MLPPFLKAGDTVSIVSPSGAIDPEYIDGAAAVLESWGLKVKIMPHAKGKCGRFAGTKEERIEDLQTAIDDPERNATFSLSHEYTPRIRQSRARQYARNRNARHAD